MTDETEIDALVDAFFAAFASGPGCAERLDALPGLFLSRAVVVRTGPDEAVYDVDGFIAPRRALLLGGALQGFREWETTRTTEVVGRIAQRSSAYAKEWIQDGTLRVGGGHKLLQLVRTHTAWRISGVVWEDMPALPA